jgi:hypothetical protein
VSGEHVPDEPPPRSDWHDVPEELVLLSGLGKPVTVVDEDGETCDQLVIVPGLFAHARRLEEGEDMNAG